MYFREKNCYSYVRQVNPTVTEFYEKINLIEKSYETIALGTGMAAIGSTISSLFGLSNHFTASLFRSGNTRVFLSRSLNLESKHCS